MFDFSFPEILIIGLVAVIVLDPRHLPDVARSAGRWMGRARRFMNKVKEDLDGHVGTEHLGPLRELNQEWQRTKSLLEESLTPSEWQEPLGDDSPDRTPPALGSPAEGRSASAAPGVRSPRRRRRRGRRAPTSSSPSSSVRDNPRKPNGGGEGV